MNEETAQFPIIKKEGGVYEVDLLFCLPFCNIIIQEELGTSSLIPYIHKEKYYVKSKSITKARI